MVTGVRLKLEATWLAIAVTLTLAVIQSGRTPAAAAPNPSRAGAFVTTQHRILDTRNPDVGGYSTPMQANVWRSVQVTDPIDIPLGSASAVTVTLNVISPQSSGVVRADKDGPNPTSIVNYLNYSAGKDQSNTAVLPLSDQGKIQILTTSSVDLLIDTQGYYSSSAGPDSGGYMPVTPQRAVDTRTGLGTGQGKLVSGSQNEFSLTDNVDLPSDATSAMLSLTVYNYTGTQSSSFKAYGAGFYDPDTTFSFAARSTSSVMAAIEIGSDGAFDQYQLAFDLPDTSPSYSLDLTVDVVGYFTPAQDASGFLATQARVWDSRASGHTSLAAGASVSIPVAGVSGLPAAGSMSAVAANLTAVSTRSNSGSLTAWADGTTRPSPYTSMAYRPGSVVSNLVTVSLGSNGAVSIYNSGPDAIDFVLDIEGYYGPTPHRVAADQMCITGSDNGCETSDVSNSPRPSLLATTTDPNGQKLRYSFEVWTLTDDETPGSLVASGSTAYIASGAQASWQVPTSAIRLRLSSTFRVRADNATSYGEWSDWYDYTVDPEPLISSISSANYPQNFASLPSSKRFDLAVATDASNPVTSLTYAMDTAPSTTVSSASLSIDLPAPTVGGHTVTLTATDSAGATNYFYYRFSVYPLAAAVSNIRVDAVGRSSLRVRWDNAAQPQTRAYVLSLRNSSSGQTVFAGRCPSSCKAATLVNIPAGTGFNTVDVVSAGDAGNGARATTGPFTLGGSSEVTCASSDSACGSVDASQVTQSGNVSNVRVQLPANDGETTELDLALDRPMSIASAHQLITFAVPATISDNLLPSTSTMSGVTSVSPAALTTDPTASGSDQAPGADTYAPAPDGTQTDSRTDINSRGPNGDHLHCDQFYDWYDHDGAFYTQRRCNATKAPSGWLASQFLKSIADGSVSQTGYTWFVDKGKKRHGKDHSTHITDYFHVTFSGIRPHGSHLSYSNNLKFRINAGGETGTAKLKIYGSMTYTNVKYQNPTCHAGSPC